MKDLQKIREEIRALLLAEVDQMRAIGATDADIQEAAFIAMVGQRVGKQMLKTLDPGEWAEVSKYCIQMASPEELRDFAKQARDQGEMDEAYQYEHLADLRERGEA